MDRFEKRWAVKNRENTRREQRIYKEIIGEEKRKQEMSRDEKARNISK